MLEIQTVPPDEYFGWVVMCILAAFFSVAFFVGPVYMFAEYGFGQLYFRPFYVHFYPIRKRLPPDLRLELERHIPFYRRLDERRKRFFEHRLHRFLDKYTFEGRAGFEITDEVRVKIASTYLMMSFGMRHYLTSVIERIVVYPEAYLSAATEAYHKGEFNPGWKAVVFSWSDFEQGNHIANDNLNLGIHEFGHVLHHHGKRSSDVSATIFACVYDRITQEVAFGPNRQKLLDSGYFRSYAYVNQFEFLAVILENYFETPAEFRQHFPVLYRNISRMLNHRH